MRQQYFMVGQDYWMAKRIQEKKPIREIAEEFGISPHFIIRVLTDLRTKRRAEREAKN